MKIKSFLIETKYVERDSFISNMAGSMLMAFQSVIMLMILTRVLGLKEAGIFTIAYANANLFLTIGKYGMRNFQVSDVRGQFSFPEYGISRVLTSAVMLIVSIGYVWYIGNKNAYSLDKSLVIIWMCVFKMVDAAEDVYHAMYQQKGRLDIAGKAMTLRLAVTILFFGIGLIVTRNLLIILIASTLLTALLFVLFTKYSNDGFEQPGGKDVSGREVIRLLKICFPLFLGTFLSFYIGNAPKYAIDSILSDELQACYGFIAMPVFVIGLLNGFIFNPMVARMSLMWNQGKIKRFVKLFLGQMLVIVLITGVCMTGAYLIGVPVLSAMYNTDLTPYKTELLILLLGGGFLAFSGLQVTIITIIRFQKSLAWGYMIVAALAYILSPVLVERYSMFGATVLYLGLMLMLCVIFGILLVYGIVTGMGKKEVS